MQASAAAYTVLMTMTVSEEVLNAATRAEIATAGGSAALAGAVLAPALDKGPAAGTAVGITLCAALLSTAVRALGARKGRTV